MTIPIVIELLMTATSMWGIPGGADKDGAFEVS
jgi:hypothetical protein